MEKSIKLSARAREYREHILKAQASSRPVRAYCKEHGLSKGVFYHHRKQMGLSKMRAKKNRFVKVKPVFEKKEAGLLKDSDMLWLAKFLKTYISLR